VFYQLAAGNAVNHNAFSRYLLPIRRDAQILPYKGTPYGHAGDDLVAFSDLIFDGMRRIREGREQEGVGLFDPFSTRCQIGYWRVMVDIVNGNKLIHDVQVSLVHFSKPTTNKGLVCF
jgi:hypothetical protein